jgi:hypothetical protein
VTGLGYFNRFALVLSRLYQVQYTYIDDACINTSRLLLSCGGSRESIVERRESRVEFEMNIVGFSASTGTGTCTGRQSI